jgi:hypothetical protein
MAEYLKSSDLTPSSAIITVEAEGEEAIAEAGGSLIATLLLLG